MRAPDTLPALREEIDAIDRQIAALLGQRLAVVRRVIAVKQREGLPALLPDRVEEVVAKARALLAGQEAPADLADAVWRPLIAWTVAYEERQLGPDGANAPARTADSAAKKG